MKRVNKNGIKFFCKVIKDGEVVSSYAGGKYGRFLSRLQVADWRKHGFEVYLIGELVDFENEGTYTDKQSLSKAIEAFMEVGRVK